MTKEKDGCATAILAMVGFMVAIPLAVMWKGFVLAKLWGWFVVSKFESIPPLSIAQAIGLAIVVSMFTGTYSSKDDEDEVWKPYVIAFLGPLISLFVGWIVKFWV